VNKEKIFRIRALFFFKTFGAGIDDDA